MDCGSEAATTKFLQINQVTSKLTPVTRDYASLTMTSTSTVFCVAPYVILRYGQSAAEKNIDNGALCGRAYDEERR
jgi:hypothetical protein